jgi:hypothetical protein
MGPTPLERCRLAHACHALGCLVCSRYDPPQPGNPNWLEAVPRRSHLKTNPRALGLARGECCSPPLEPGCP